ncbi:hypothetical protein FSARC_7278 [Fusarium sarcochroum]|uniref:Acetylesterase n=1 Tax=Fusarium sarcochroum TaxID=1208366 RepID=A0A8H4X868_9HYPO|nr:hypothetical protein FSARC_7278 [Fusarium sarcochroum]
MPRTQTQAAQTPTAVALIVSMVLCIVALPFLVRPPNFDGIFGPIEKTVENPLPDERFLINFISGDSFSETGLSLNWTYVRTGYDMGRVNRTSRPNVPGPRPENPIGSPEWPGETTSGGENWVTYLTATFNTTPTFTYNFARNGSVIDKKVTKPDPRNGTTFVDQILHFNDSIGHQPDHAAWTSKNAIVTIWLGSREVTRALEGRQTLDYLRFVVMDVPPLNLMPGFDRDKLGLRNYERLTQAIKSWNDHLRDNYYIFKDEFPEAKMSLVETTNTFYYAYLKPKKFGVPDQTCHNSDGVSCLWKDEFHPGQKIHKYIARDVAEAAWDYE